MKAFLTAHGVSYPLTHKLEKLEDLLARANETLPPMPYNILKLEPYAVALRYDTSKGLSPEERIAIAESVVILREHTLTRILELEKASTP